MVVGVYIYLANLRNIFKKDNYYWKMLLPDNK